MFRFLFDEDGDGHKDLLVKLDVMISSAWLVDTYYLLESFNGDDFTSAAHSYLEWVTTELTKDRTDVFFIPILLSDQSFGGFFVERQKRGLLLFQYGTSGSEPTFTFSFSHPSSESLDRASFKLDAPVLISREGALNGLAWSLNRLERLSAGQG